MTKVKRFFVFLLSAAVLLSFAGCNSKENLQESMKKEEYTVVCSVGAGKTLNDISEIKGMKIGVLDEEAQNIALFYGAAEVVLKVNPQESFSDLQSGKIDFLMCKTDEADPSLCEIALEKVNLSTYNNKKQKNS